MPPNFEDTGAAHEARTDPAADADLAAPTGTVSDSSFTATPESAIEECTTGNEAVCLDPTMEEAAYGAAPPRSAVTQDAATYTVEEYIVFVLEDLNKKWIPWFTDNGLQTPIVYYDVVYESETPRELNCALNGEYIVVPHDLPNAYYCGADPYPGLRQGDNGLVIFPVSTMYKMWNGDVLGTPSKVSGDFAAAVIVAHEFGHHVTDELHMQVQVQDPLVSLPTGSNFEAIADCFAGNWMHTTYYDGLLEPGDYDEAVAALVAIGAPTEGMSHPTAEQRERALLIGYNTGDPQACITEYWK